MSQDNVKIVRAGFEAWNAGDMETVREAFDPDVIMRTPEGWPEPGPYVGRDAVMRQLLQNRATWDSDTLEPTSDFLDAGDRVAVRAIWRGAGRGPDSSMEFTHVHMLRKSKTVFLEFFWDHAEALETLGQRERAVSLENLEVVRRWFAPWSGDIRAAILECWDPDADYYPVRKFPEARPCHGLEEISQFMAGYLDAFTRYESTVKEVYDLGDDRILTCANLVAEGRGSGIKVESNIYQCWWLRHGRFLRGEDHLTLRGALHALGFEGDTIEAAGLSE